MSVADTYQKVAVQSKEGKAFLRKAMRRLDDWQVRARAPEWEIVFYRDIAGDVGEPNVTVEVTTDAVVTPPPHYDIGPEVAVFRNAPVLMPEPRAMYLHSWDTSLIAWALLNGSEIRIGASCGSVSSSRHGLGFYSVEVDVFQGKNRVGSITVGGKTVIKDGETIIIGPVMVGQ